MIKTILLSALLLISFGLSAQWKINSTVNEGENDNNTGVDYSLNVGSQIGSSFNGGYFFNNYISPSAAYNFNTKTTLEVGLGTSFTQMNSPFIKSMTEGEQESAGITSVFAYANGIYKVSPKVHLNASILMEEQMTNIQGYPGMQNRFQDVQVGINYQIAPKVTINAQFGFSNRPYYSNYYRNSRFNDGFNNSFSPFYW